MTKTEAPADLHPHGRVDRRAVGGHRPADVRAPGPGRGAGAGDDPVVGDITDGFAVDQLTHCLQTAALAEQAGADDELVVASLCHDIGKAVSVSNHPVDRGRDPPAVRVRRRVPDDPRPSGLPGPALLPRTSAATRTPASSTGGRRGSRSPSSSPTSGTSKRSTRISTRRRSSISRAGCVRCSRSLGCLGAQHRRAARRVRAALARTSSAPSTWPSRISTWPSTTVTSTTEPDAE